MLGKGRRKRLRYIIEVVRSETHTPTPIKRKIPGSAPVSGKKTTDVNKNIGWYQSMSYIRG
jgi:hypothetical protein